MSPHLGGTASNTQQHGLLPFFPHTHTQRGPLTFHLDVAGAPVSRLDSILVLVADAHVGQGRAHGVSGAVAVGGVVHVVHGRWQVRLQGGLGDRRGGTATSRDRCQKPAK